MTCTSHGIALDVMRRLDRFVIRGLIHGTYYGLPSKLKAAPSRA